MMCIPLSELGDALTTFEVEGVELLHVDVMDGVFVPNLMLGTNYIRDLRAASSIPLDLHLMIEEPADKLAWFSVRPGEWVSIHAEATSHLQRSIQRVRELGGRPRVALNPATPLTELDWVLDDIDGVLLMTVNPGFAGQSLIPQTIGKIRALRDRVEARGLDEFDIEVDGNVSLSHAVLMATAGATTFVLGSSALLMEEGALGEELRAARHAATPRAGESL